MSENKGELNLSRMASTELPGKGEFFFLYKTISRDPKYGTGGSIWVVGSEAGEKLARGGIDSVLEDPELEESAAHFLIAQGKIGDRPGLTVDYYNDPTFGDQDFDPPEGRARGVIDVLAKASKKDPLLSSVREMFRGVLQARAQEIGRDNDRNGVMSINNVFFDEIADPGRVIATIFEGYRYETGDTREIPGGIDINISLPLRQFLE